MSASRPAHDPLALLGAYIILPCLAARYHTTQQARGIGFCPLRTP